jgi:succinate-semialdehyde dehydrogenase/glutarate-semialdehyde dehydrogenase
MSEQAFESINPANGDVFATTRIWADDAVEKALKQTARRAKSWARTSLVERCALLEAVADQLDNERDRLAGLVTAEMGKLSGEARAEVEKCAWVCRYYAENAEAFLADEPVNTDAQRSLVAHQPLGAVLAVMPWNFPLWQVFRFAAPAVAVGNVGLLKHASNVMLCSEAIEDIFNRAGAPPGLFTQLPIRSSKVADLIADRRVAAVTLTGSEPAGRAVAGQAGKALKKSVLELGGSDPFIVLEDADLDRAVEKAVQSRYMNAGQSCIAAKRFIVVQKIADTFEQKLVKAAAELRPGDPSDDQTTLAPMARADLREEIHAQVEDALSHGAQLLTGGDAVDGAGFFYKPTVLSGITPQMRAYEEELFGPVASLFRVPDEAQAVQLANDSEFGLGGSVWTQDRDRGVAVARQLDCGCVFVNELVKSDPRVPFGGVKSSGYGRELSHHGIREFVNVKTVWVE